jgi:hypothetical protein
VAVFGRAPEKLAKITDQFGFAATTDLNAVITDSSVDLVDICLPTRLLAEVAECVWQHPVPAAQRAVANARSPADTAPSTSRPASTSSPSPVRCLTTSARPST